MSRSSTAPRTRARAIATTIVPAIALLVALTPLGAAAAPAGQPAFAWGSNSTASLGTGSESGATGPVPVLLPAGTVSVAAGADSAFAVTADGVVFAWGANGYGQLGTGDTAARAVPTAIAFPSGVRIVEIATSGTHTLARAEDGTVWSWGRNHHGQLGLSDSVDRTAPEQVPLPDAAVDIATGQDHSAAALANGAVLTWGTGERGRLGNGALLDQTAPVTALPAGSGATQVAAGDGFTVALVAGGEVVAWGDRRVAGGDDSSTPVAIAGLSGIVSLEAGASHALALDGSGTVFAWGGGERGQLGTDDPSVLVGTGVGAIEPIVVALPAAEQISAAGGLSVALTRDGRVFAWGDNAYGQLGDPAGGDHRPAPTETPGLAGSAVESVEAGPASAFAIVSHGGPARLVIGPDDAALVAGRAFTFTVTAFDAFGNDLGAVTDVALTLDGAPCDGLTCMPRTTGPATVVALSPAAENAGGGSTVVVPPGSLGGFAKVTVAAAPPPSDGGDDGPGGILGLTGSTLAISAIAAAAVLVAAGITVVLVTRARRRAAQRALTPKRHAITASPEKE